MLFMEWYYGIIRKFNCQKGDMMTNKEQFIHNLHQARIGSVRWVGSIKLLSSDLPIKDYKFELSLLDTEFGKWFYEEASLITATNSLEIIDTMEHTLIAMHKHFMDIHDMCVTNRKKTFLGTTKALDSTERTMAFTYYQEIVRMSDEFQKLLRRFERIIQAKSDEEFTMFAYALEINKEKDLKEDVKKEESRSSSLGGARGAYLD